MSTRVLAETAQQLVQLKALNCEYAQGYYFGRPTDSDTAWSLVSRPGGGLTVPCIGRAVPPSLAAQAAHPLS
jgi:predicted signal transduction protein with EAL and GGDEF domain